MTLRLGMDYRPALVNREGIGRATRELVRALPSAMTAAERLALFGWTLRAPRFAPDALGTTGNTQLSRMRFPARWTNAALALCGGADGLLGANVFHHTQPRRLRVSRAATTTMIWDLLFLDAEGRPGGPWVAAETAQAMAASAKRAADESDLILVPTEFVRQEVIVKLRIAPERVRTVGLGAAHLPAPDFDALHTRPPFLLTVARIDPRKNHALVLAAFERLVAMGLPHHWLVVGPNGWRAETFHAAVAQSPVRHRIKHIANASDAEVAALVATAEAFVFPSRGEGFGLPPVEAQCAGIPVVAMRTSCLPEVLGDGCAWIEPDTFGAETEALATTLRDVLSNHATRADLIARGTQNAARHTWAQSAARHLEAWRPLTKM